ncbi:hypothetical protein HJ01_03170 [Flavobacterium frigoris PS1]|uniref:Uncharacterized protein n=1 Tax=Flavobacterium frigoris (strain PS1) TaxID=1086011 RepID=H7FVH2_FLAFP|nr:hypothetical protein HJ01_03170 [Flavobacterium frigoris PS1]
MVHQCLAEKTRINVRKKAATFRAAASINKDYNKLKGVTKLNVLLFFLAESDN